MNDRAEISDNIYYVHNLQKMFDFYRMEVKEKMEMHIAVYLISYYFVKQSLREERETSMLFSLGTGESSWLKPHLENRGPVVEVVFVWTS